MRKPIDLQKKHIFTVLAVLFVFTGIIFLIHHLTESETVQNLVGQLGYVGVLITGVIGGLNSFVPVPAAAFTPVFVAAGLSIPLIVLALAIGTLIADFVGYILGHASRNLILQKHPRIFHTITKIHTKHQKWIIPTMAAYAAFVPFPNELLIIPLALSGMRFSHMAVPLLIGNIVNQTIYTYSALSLIEVVF